jgi:diguanylate cyclase (GGDEF)-like protein
MESQYNLPLGADEMTNLAASAVEYSFDSFVILDSVGQIVYKNTAFSRMFKGARGKTLDLLFGQGYHAFISTLTSAGKFDGVLTTRVGGASTRLKFAFFAVYNEIGEANHYAGIIRDLDSREAGEADPNHDRLTGALTRTAFMSRLEHCVAVAEKKFSTLAVLYINPLDFSGEIKARGFAAGDELLRTYAAVLARILDKSYPVARIKADIFAVIVQDVFEQDDLESLCRKIMDELAKTDTLAFAIGAAMYPISGDSPDELVSNAEKAAEAAKSKGPNKIAYHRTFRDEA